MTLIMEGGGKHSGVNVSKSLRSEGPEFVKIQGKYSDKHVFTYSKDIFKINL